MPEDWRDDYVEKIIKAKMRRIAEIGAYLMFPNASIVKSHTCDGTTYRINIELEDKTPRSLIMEQSEIKTFLTYSVNEKAKTKLMAFILGAHD